MPFYLALKEIWRGRGRFILFSMVIALITVLVLFVAAAGGGAGVGQPGIPGEAQRRPDRLSVERGPVGRREPARGRSLEPGAPRARCAGDRSDLGTASAALILGDDRKPLNVALIGVEPGLPGEPPALKGAGLRSRRSKEAVIDRQTALRAGLGVGDTLTVKSIQDTQEQFYNLRVVGISDNRQFSSSRVCSCRSARGMRFGPRPRSEATRMPRSWRISSACR